MNDIIEIKAKLLGSLLLFTQYFYKLRTGREFIISDPIGREPHHITICKELTKVFYLETKRLLINVPPGHGKSELCIHFIAWAMAHYPDSNFLYISYAKDLAAKHTYSIKCLMELPAYKKIFGVELRKDSAAKDNFKTIQGGSVMAFGSSGAITGQDAGLPNQERFTGCVLIDDFHKPDEVHSDTIREGCIENYNQTIKPRVRGPNVPILGIGQRLHEADLFGFLAEKKDGYDWRKVILKAIDEAGNVLHPAVNPREMLLIEKETNPYVFSAQYQQDPQPAGGGIFKPEWFHLMDEEPNIIATFITADTAETDKDYNDASVFSFWGVYYIQQMGVQTDILGLHWIDCLEIRVEPKDLKPEFMQFYADCMRHKVKPRLAAIEKKSTGVTLLSILNEMQGLQTIDVNRKGITPSLGFKNKTARFLAVQPYVASKRVSLPRYGKHTHMCLEHCKKITANESHRWDDIADTLADAVRVGLIDQTIVIRGTSQQNPEIAKQVMSGLSQLLDAKRAPW